MWVDDGAVWVRLPLYYEGAHVLVRYVSVRAMLCLDAVAAVVETQFSGLELGFGPVPGMGRYHGAGWLDEVLKLVAESLLDLLEVYCLRNLGLCRTKTVQG